MSEFTTTDFQGSVNFTRGPELISIGDGDIVSFIPDVLTNGAVAAMSIGGIDLYNSNASDSISAGDRIMMWGRISSATGDLVGPLRWLSYFTENTGTVGNAGNSGADSIAVLRDAFSPRVTYDKQNNRLALWFWTNVKSDYDGAIYDPSELHTVVTSSNSIDSAFGDAKRVLCYAVGSFYHETITGGEVSGLGTPASLGNDIVPIFNTPQIITVGTGAQTGIMLDSLVLQDGQTITEPLRCRFLNSPHRKYTSVTDDNPDVGMTGQDEFELIEGVIKLPHADLTFGGVEALDPLPADGTPTFVYIKVSSWCEEGATGAIEMFDAEKTETELKDDLENDDFWWIKLAKVEAVLPEASSSDGQYTNPMSTVGITALPPTSWNSWYIQPYELPHEVPEGRRIQMGQGASAPTWFAKATQDSSTSFTADIYGNGPNQTATIMGVTVENDTGVEVLDGDLLSVLEYCGSFFLTKKGEGGASGGGACIEILFDTPLLLAKNMLPKHVVLRGHTEPNDYNMQPFQLDGTSVLIPELCIVRRNSNPSFDDLLPETLTGNPEYLDNEFCVIVTSVDDPCSALADGDLSSLTGCCTGLLGDNPNEWILAVTMECVEATGGTGVPFMAESLMEGMSSQERKSLKESALHKLKNNSRGGGCCPVRAKKDDGKN